MPNLLITVDSILVIFVILKSISAKQIKFNKHFGFNIDTYISIQKDCNSLKNT